MASNKANIFDCFGDKAPFAVVEAYKNIRIRLLSILEKTDGKVITFSSPNASEGKSTTAVNMAIALSQLNKKVALVDADIRRATIDKKLSIDNKRGLSELLKKECNFEKAVVHYNDYLDVLTSGNGAEDPSDLIGSVEFDELIKILREKYDYVIIDTPPVNIVSDALSIAQKCDGVILITRIAATTFKDVKSAVHALEELNINVLGTIINGEGASKKRYNSYYKYNYS